MRMDYVISKFNYFEGILFHLARQKSTVYVVVSLDKAVKNHNRYSALLPFDYIPYLPNFFPWPPCK